MRIIIEEPGEGEADEIIVRCREMTDEVLRALSILKGDGQKLVAYLDSEIHTLPPGEVYYFESVENKTFIYCEKKVYTSRQKLYELEEMFSHSSFLRVSKSVLLNLKVISFLSPAFNGRLEATLLNGEKIIITRSYTNALKTKLGL